MSDQQSHASIQTLSASLWQVDGNLALIRSLILALLGSALLAISAKVQVPFYPVPITMTSLVVLLIGGAFGARLAGATVALYLAEGLLFGIPVFAGPVAGLSYLASPTIGYLLAFLPAAILVGYLAEKGMGRTVVSAFVMMAIGSILILALGAGWLSYVIGFDKAITFGVKPFILGDALKLGLASSILPLAWKAIRR